MDFIQLGRLFSFAVGGYRGAVLWSVIEGSWLAPLALSAAEGPEPETPWVRPSTEELARQSGLDEGRLAGAERELIEHGLLVSDGHGHVRPGTAFEKWTVPFGSPEGTMTALVRDAASLLVEADEGGPGPPGHLLRALERPDGQDLATWFEHLPAGP